MPEAAPVTAPSPATTVTARPAARPVGPSRDALLADMAKLSPEAPPLMKVSGDRDASVADAAEKVAAEAEVEAKPDAPVEADADAVEPEPVVEAKPDRDTEKRLDVVRKAEARAKQALATERKAIADERATFETERKQHSADVAELKQMAQRARTHPWEFFQKLTGATEADAEFVSRAIYAHAPAAKNDPKNRAAVDAAIKEREGSSRLERLEAELAETNKKLADRDSHAARQRDADEYMTSVTKAVADEHPRVKSLLAKNPAKANHALAATALRLAQEAGDGDAPMPDEVLAAYEKELEDLGVPAAAVAAKPVEVAAKSKTLGSGGGATAVKPKKLSPAESRAELLREMNSLDAT